MEILNSNIDKKVWGRLFTYTSQLDRTTQAKYGLALRQWMRFLNSDPSYVGSGFVFLNADDNDAIKFSNELIKSGKSKRTIRSITSKIKKAYRILMLAGVAKSTPFSLVRPMIIGDDEPALEILKFSDVYKMIERPDGTLKGLRDRTILSLLFGCALRPAELSSLKVDQLCCFEETTYLKLEKTKTGKVRNQVVPSWALLILSEYLDALSKHGQFEHILVSFPHQRKIKSGITTKSIRLIFKHYAKELGYDDKISSYSARATTISKLVFDKKPLREIAIFAGHSSTQMIEVYDKRVRNLSESLAHELNFL